MASNFAKLETHQVADLRQILEERELERSRTKTGKPD